MTQIKASLLSGVLRVTLVPPAGKPPTLNERVLDQLSSVLATAELEIPDVLVIESAESRYFCVGADVDSLRRTTVDTIDAWIRRGHDVFNRLEALPCPTVARVDGYALGGGLELALACDLIYASGGATFGQPEAKLGFVPGWGGCRRLPNRVGLAAAKRLFFTAQLIDAAEARMLGLADFVGTASEVEQALAGFVEQCRGCSRSAIAAFKRMTVAAERGAQQHNVEAESAASRECLLDPDTTARITAFLQRKQSPAT